MHTTSCQYIFPESTNTKNVKVLSYGSGTGAELLTKRTYTRKRRTWR